MAEPLVTVTVEGNTVVVTAVTGAVLDRASLNSVLADRLSDMLKEHFRAKAAVPNKLGGKRTMFWNKMADATSVESYDADGAVVAVADRRFNVHLYGGEIRPTEKPFLTVPIHPLAHGRFAGTLETEEQVNVFGMGRKLPGGGSRAPRAGDILAANFGKTLVPLYVLKESVNIGADPQALPEADAIRTALTEEAGDFIGRAIRRETAGKGGAA
jgi:hypothetical protein